MPTIRPRAIASLAAVSAMLVALVTTVGAPASATEEATTGPRQGPIVQRTDQPFLRQSPPYWRIRNGAPAQHCLHAAAPPLVDQTPCPP
ncbi:hypothetical protein, partial [Kibdelosporangium aridum]|uniref:hypothetical protein n=1 Tax=Kibdelosporangium aridum TaxID=2030 RepID=UPI001C8B15D7